jgi:ProP effector
MPQKDPLKSSSPVVILRKKRPAPSATSQAATSPPTAQPPPRGADGDPAVPAAPAAAKAPPQRRPARTPKRAAPSPPPPAKPRQPANPLAAPAPVANTGPPNRRQRDAQAQRELFLLLQNRWPHVFPSDVRALKPLAIGIHREIAAQLPGFSLWLIKRTIARFQQSAGGAYWRVVRQGGPRYDLEGNPRGTVTPEEQEKAQQTLDELRAKKQQQRSDPAAAHTAVHAANAPVEA